MQAHYLAALRILKYLKNALGLGLFFLFDLALYLKEFSDSDWATHPNIRWPSLATTFTLAIPLFPGSPRSRILSHALLPRLSIVLLLPPLVKFSGSLTCSKIFMSLSSLQPYFIMTAILFST